MRLNLKENFILNIIKSKKNLLQKRYYYILRNNIEKILIIFINWVIWILMS